MPKYVYSAVFHPNEDDGSITVTVPDLPGCITEGKDLADTDEYRRKNDSRAVKKTLSIPNWLNTQAEQAGVNFSQVLQDALKERLHVN